VSNRWFPAKERAQATALSAFMSILGGGLALILGPFFATRDEDVVDLTLKSCKVNELPAATVNAYNASQLNNTLLDCAGDFAEATESFCCYQPTNIESLDLLMAIVPTFCFFLCVLSVRDNPPTPPSAAGEEKESVGIVEGVTHLFKEPRFRRVALADFIVSGPALSLFSGVSRLFPAEIDDLAFVASAAGLALAIPTAWIVSYRLDHYHAYYTYSAGGYTLGAVFWWVATFSFLGDSDIGNYFFLFCIVVAVLLFIAWQGAIYELKFEYTFSQDYYLEGSIVGTVSFFLADLT